MKFRKKPVVIEAIQFDGTEECTNVSVSSLDMGRYNLAHPDSFCDDCRDKTPIS